MTVLAVLSAIGVAVGLTLVIAASRPGGPRPSRPVSAVPQRRRLSATARRNALIGLGIGVVLALTGWVIALVLAPALAVLLPYLVRKDDSVSPDDLEALEEWARSLAGVIGAGQGISSAIIATRASAPERIRPQLERLIARLYARRPLDEALYAFADDVDNQVGDFIATALIQASRHEGAALRKALDGIAVDVTQEVRARRDIEASRAGTRAQARIVTIIALSVLALFVLVTPLGSYYRTSSGQLMLMLVHGLFLGALYWLRKAATTTPLARFLVAPAPKERA